MHCYQCNCNGASSSILLYFKFDWCLFGLSFSEVSCRAETCQLICGAYHLTGSFMVQDFARWCFQTDFSCLTFYQYLSLPLIESQCCRIIEEFHFSIYPWCRCVLWRARVGIFNALNLKHKWIQIWKIHCYFWRYFCFSLIISMPN